MSENSVSPCPADIEAIEHLKQAISSGKHWYIALLEAIGLWGSAEEVYDGQHFFFAKPPVELSREEFSRLIGDTKYRANLNYVYGVSVEEALVSVVEEEIYKERNNFANCQDDHVQQEAYHRVYGADMTTLLGQFREERDYPRIESITLAEQKEFTYWLFRYRLDHCDKERVASDTKKALQWLQRQWAAGAKRKPETQCPL